MNTAAPSRKPQILNISVASKIRRKTGSPLEGYGGDLLVVLEQAVYNSGFEVFVGSSFYSRMSHSYLTSISYQFSRERESLDDLGSHGVRQHHSRPSSRKGPVYESTVKNSTSFTTTLAKRLAQGSRCLPTEVSPAGSLQGQV